MNHMARITVVALAVGLAAGIARGQSDGPNNPATVVDDASIGSNPWSNTAAASVSDNVYAFAAVGAASASHYLKATDFGFSIPPAAVILGIEVDVEKLEVGGVIHDNAVLIVQGGTITGTDHSNPNEWPMSDAVVSYGSPSDLWGLSWTPSDINSSGFGVAISGKDSVSGALARVDSISITVSYGLCGDNILAPNEQCDDGNTSPGDCCSATCQFESTGSPCPDGNLCNGNETCDGAGACVPGTPLDCDDNDVCSQDSCSPTLGCQNVNAPRGSCRTAQKALLLIKNNASDSKDKLVWKWLKGQQTVLGDLGSPTGTTAYTLCVYAGTSTAMAATIDGGSNWHALGGSKGYKYKDPSGNSDGITKALLKVGANGKAKAQVKGKGNNLPDPTLPLPLPVTAQLVNDENTVCYTTPLTTVKKNTTAQFKAKSP